MHRAMIVDANREFAAKLLAVNDDGRFGGFERHHWFRYSNLRASISCGNDLAMEDYPLPIRPRRWARPVAGIGFHAFGAVRALPEC